MTASAYVCGCEPENRVVKHRVCRICGRLEWLMTLFFLAIRFSSKLWRRSLSKMVVPLFTFVLLMVAPVLHGIEQHSATCRLVQRRFSAMPTVCSYTASFERLSLAHLCKEELLWQTIVFHACDVPIPSKLSFVEVGFNAENFSVAEDFLSCYVCIPFNVQNLAEVARRRRCSSFFMWRL